MSFVVYLLDTSHSLAIHEQIKYSCEAVEGIIEYTHFVGLSSCSFLTTGQCEGLLIVKRATMMQAPRFYLYVQEPNLNLPLRGLGVNNEKLIIKPCQKALQLSW